MANHDALRDLQTRLAERLQAASAGPSASGWLAVQAGGRNYLLPLAQAGEIFPLVGVQAVPHTVAWFVGVAGLRGSLYSVVDLAGFLTRLETGRPAGASFAPDQARLVTLNQTLEAYAALKVDALCGLRNASELTPLNGADVRQARQDAAYLGPEYADANGQRWQVLLLSELVRHPRFLAIGT